MGLRGLFSEENFDVFFWFFYRQRQHLCKTVGHSFGDFFSDPTFGWDVVLTVLHPKKSGKIFFVHKVIFRESYEK